MNLVYKTKFGSHLYGTNVATSDEDFKGIYIPEQRDIILQRTKKVIQLNEKHSTGTKNQAGDKDFEVFSFQEFIKLLMEGQTVALDMLFAGFHHDHMVSIYKDAMYAIETYRTKFLHKGTSSFVGYCRTQASKYGLKGGRVAAMRAAVDFLKGLPQDDKLEKHWETIESLSKVTEHMMVEIVEGPNQRLLPHWDVCDRKMGQTVKVGYALEVYQKVFDAYGHRAKLAEKNENIDWKALMHAVRVCEEAKELLLTGHITFPRPEKELLLKIRKQELPYREVSEIIERGLVEVEEAKAKSTLREEPDREFADELVYEIYLNAIK